MQARRAPWTGREPDVLIAAPESLVKKHPSYADAKAGDLVAAWALVSDALSEVSRDAWTALLGPDTVLAAVHAYEGVSINRIPAAAAQWLAGRFGCTVDRSLVQINRVGHTGSSGWNRLANQALFDGSVIAGARYVLVDDFVGQGGTFANLRGFILENGGLVDGFVSITGQARSATIALRPQTLTRLRSQHAELEPWWEAHLGFDFAALTASEAGYLLRVDADTVRSRLLEAGQGGNA